MSHWVMQFSSPHACDERVFGTINDTYGAGVTEIFLHTFRDIISSHSHGIVDFINNWLVKPHSKDVTWNLAFGRAELAIQSSKIDPIETALRLALRIAESNFAGSWCAEIPFCAGLFGNIILPTIKKIEFNSDGLQGCINATTSKGEQIEIKRDSKNTSWKTNNAEYLRSIGINRPIYFFPSSALPGNGYDVQGFEAINPINSIDNEILDSFNDGLNLIAKYAPNYLIWIEQVLRGILPCHHKSYPIRSESGSNDYLLGIIYASHPLPRMDIAELLIHECAHQYFYMVEKVSPVTDINDKTLYWSPPIRKNRPLNRILMAYHALANVRLFYEMVGKSNEEDVNNYLASNAHNMTDVVDCLNKHLLNNPSLTENGRRLYEPLVAKVSTLPSYN